MIDRFRIQHGLIAEQEHYRWKRLPDVYQAGLKRPALAFKVVVVDYYLKAFMVDTGPQCLQYVLMVVSQHQNDMVQLGFQGGVQDILKEVFSFEFQNLFWVPKS